MKKKLMQLMVVSMVMGYAFIASADTAPDPAKVLEATNLKKAELNGTEWDVKLTQAGGKGEEIGRAHV